MCRNHWAGCLWSLRLGLMLTWMISISIRCPLTPSLAPELITREYPEQGPQTGPGLPELSSAQLWFFCWYLTWILAPEDLDGITICKRGERSVLWSCTVLCCLQVITLNILLGHNATLLDLVSPPLCWSFITHYISLLAAWLAVDLEVRQGGAVDSSDCLQTCPVCWTLRSAGPLPACYYGVVFHNHNPLNRQWKP